MIVTKIEQYAKGRYRIFIDEEYAFVLYQGELKTYHIEEGEPIEEKNYELIMSEVLVKRARLRAMNLLMKRNYTVRQLRDKLSDGGYPEEIIQNAIDYVCSYGYVDDMEYASEYIRIHNMDKSITRIKQDLIKKGIDKDIITKALDEKMNSVDAVDEYTQVIKLLEKRHFDRENSTYEETTKVYAYLMRKGYSSSVINKAIRTNFDGLYD